MAKAETTKEKPKKTYPAWLGQLSQRDEARRRAVGLYAGKDGWYKTVDLRKRYIAKPMPLDQVLAVLEPKVDEIRGVIAETPVRVATGSTTIYELVEMFLAHLWQRYKTGQPRKLSRRTYTDYCDTLARFVECVGVGALAITAGPSWFTRFSRTISHKAAASRRRDIIYITAFFNWAGPGRHSLNFYKEDVSFGPDFVKPEESEVRSEIAEASKLYTAEQYFDALMAVRSNPLLFAAGLLGLNCAYLASDVTALHDGAVKLEEGVIEFPRPKTGIDRKAVLMPETIHALRRYLATRPARRDTDRVFVRDDGQPFNVRRDDGPEAKGSHGDSVGAYWRQITGMPFSGLRTTFATIADDAKDQRAVDVVMGHAAKTVREKHYVKRFEPSRLREAVEHVWSQFVAAVPLPTEASISAAVLIRQAGRRAASDATRHKPRAKSGSGAAASPASTRHGPAARPSRSAS